MNIPITDCFLYSYSRYNEKVWTQMNIINTSATLHNLSRQWDVKLPEYLWWDYVYYYVIIRRRFLQTIGQPPPSCTPRPTPWPRDPVAHRRSRGRAPSACATVPRRRQAAPGWPSGRRRRRTAPVTARPPWSGRATPAARRWSTANSSQGARSRNLVRNRAESIPRLLRYLTIPESCSILDTCVASLVVRIHNIV